MAESSSEREVWLVPSIDIADETYVAIRPGMLAPELTATPLLAEWFPSVTFVVFMDRGDNGTRWSVTGAFEGSVEVWLEPIARGTLVHWFLRGEHSAGARGVGSHYVDLLQARMFAFKDDAEGRHVAVGSRRG